MPAVIKQTRWICEANYRGEWFACQPCSKEDAQAAAAVARQKGMAARVREVRVSI